MTLRTIIIHSFLYTSLLILSSCTFTKMIWGDKSYQDDIGKFLIGADGKYVSFIGERHHYVFTDNTGILKEVLAINQKGVLVIVPSKTYLKLRRNNTIRGYLVMSGPFNFLSPKDQALLISLGLKPNKEDDIKIRIKLIGTRYLSENVDHNTLKPTSASYEIKIHYSPRSSAGKNIGKTIITPIAVALDIFISLPWNILKYSFSL